MPTAETEDPTKSMPLALKSLFFKVCGGQRGAEGVGTSTR